MPVSRVRVIAVSIVLALSAAVASLVPALRAMRQPHYAGWIAERWHDPAFPAAFPFAGEARWWEQHIADLHEIADDLL